MIMLFNAREWAINNNTSLERLLCIMFAFNLEYTIILYHGQHYCDFLSERYITILTLLSYIST